MGSGDWFEGEKADNDGLLVADGTRLIGLNGNRDGSYRSFWVIEAASQNTLSVVQYLYLRLS
jgi:hypothetical protein